MEILSRDPACTTDRFIASCNTQNRKGFSLATTTSTVRTTISPAFATLILLIALNLLNYIDRYILPGELSLVQNEFHATREQLGALTTAMFFVYMFAAPLTGWLGDRYRRKPLAGRGGAASCRSGTRRVLSRRQHQRAGRFVIEIGRAHV